MKLYLFFFNDTATTEIYTLSLHDALPISGSEPIAVAIMAKAPRGGEVKTRLCPPLSLADAAELYRDRKSTRLNSSHSQISYAVFCLKKKKTSKDRTRQDHKQHADQLSASD